MEPRFGRDFSQVRIHHDARSAESAKAVNAQAYTIGQNVVFDSGHYAPKTQAGRRLLAHELAHTVQQSMGNSLRSDSMRMSEPGDTHEREAETAAGKAVASNDRNARVPRIHPATPSLQRAPAGPQAKTVEADTADFALEKLQVAKGALNLAANLLFEAPLSTEEMYELLLIRRAEPLSIPATVVNEAPARLKELDAKIAAVDKQISDADAELKQLRAKRKTAKSFSREMIKREIKKIEATSRSLAPQRKRLLADRARLRRGQSLGTIGMGAPAGTGQITYAGIQVVDASGKRIAVEFAETSSTEHAEERIIGRLRTKFTPDQLKGARLIVVGDQKVCAKRCQRALIAFAREFGLASVSATRFVRPRIGRPGDASARTTVVTATQPKSAGLPVREITEEIYRRPTSPAPEPAVKPSAPPRAPTGIADGPDAPKVAVRTSADDAEPARSTARVSPRPPPVRARGGRMAMQVGANFIADFIVELLMTKYQQWRNDVNLKERLMALQPWIMHRKMAALHAHLNDPWGSGTAGLYYNILLRITSTTTTAIGGGHAVVIPGSPRPKLIQVSISANDLNQLVDESEAVRIFTLREGATGGVLQNSDTQLVVYSEPIQ